MLYYLDRDEFEVIKAVDEAFAPVAHYRIRKAHTEPKEDGSGVLSEELKEELVSKFRNKAVDAEVSRGFGTNRIGFLRMTASTHRARTCNWIQFLAMTAR